MTGLGVLPIAFKNLRPTDEDLTRLPIGDFLQSDGVHHIGLHPKEGNSQALFLGAIGWVVVRWCHRLRQAVALHISQSPVHELLSNGLWHGCPSAIQAPKRAEVVLSQFGAGEQVHDHGGCGAEAAHLVALNAFRSQLSVPAGQQNDCGACIKGTVHATLHAGDVKKRKRCQSYIVRFCAEPGLTRTQSGHHRAVGVHTALGYTRGAGRVRHHAQVI